MLTILGICAAIASVVGLSIAQFALRSNGGAGLAATSPPATAAISLKGAKSSEDIPTSSTTGVTGVLVLDGAGTAGIAQRTATSLTLDGFVIAGIGTAARQHIVATTIAYRPGELSTAQAISRLLIGHTLLIADPRQTPGIVTLTIGSTFDGVRSN